ncbi:MAG TPA: sulfite exporter TauE/SafE family protein [Methylomirabilota bacterium]|jgi:uncharacterized membrane protein YfcA|nr:sulfite exporter TauE/SafE family protein [Methylomirabilota bacterium]
MWSYLWLVPVGGLVGAYGTLIGAGGGFVLVPFLLLLYPTESPEIITSISLAVVFFNALSGSLAYARHGRIDYQAGRQFAPATIPGAILGALSTAYLPRHVFDLVMGVLMIMGASVLLWRPLRNERRAAKPDARHPPHTVIERDGSTHTFAYNPRTGIWLSVLVGYLSSLLGIGGGIIHVPALVHLLHFPVHIATATSHFVLAIMAATGTVVHILTGTFVHGVRRTIALSLGVFVGAQVGAWCSHRVHGAWIIRSLALALGLVGIRLLFAA